MFLDQSAGGSNLVPGRALRYHRGAAVSQKIASLLEGTLGDLRRVGEAVFVH